MSPDPREQLVDVVEALSSESVADFQDDDDDGWGSYDSSVDVESGHDRDDEEAQGHLEQQEYLPQKANLASNMRHENTGRSDVHHLT